MQLGERLSRLRGGSFLLHSGLLFAAAMLANAGAFVYHAAVSRVLGVADYGALYALMALLPLTGIPTTALATVVTKFAAEFRALHDDSHLHALVRRLSLWLAATVALTVLACVLLQVQIAAFLHVPRSAVVAGGALIGITLALPPLRAVLQGLEDFGRYTVSAALEGMLKTGLGIAFAVAGLGVAGALWGYALGTFAALAYTWAALERRYAGTAAGDLNLNLRRLLATTAGAVVLITTITALSYGDALVVKHYMSASESGLYAAVSLGGKVLLYVTSFIPLVVLPKAANRAAAGTSPAPVFLGAAAMWAGLSAAALLAFYFAPELVVRALVGTKFLSAAPLLFGYAVAMSLLGAMNLVASYKIALHRFDFVYPFALLTVAELTTIVFYHPSLQAVIYVLVAGNACGVLASLYRIGEGRNLRTALRS